MCNRVSKEERAVGAVLGDLSETMKRSFSFQSVDCRTSTCVAQLAWPNENAARLDLQSLLGAPGLVERVKELRRVPTLACLRLSKMT
jgi:hypothetical protein